MLTSPRAALKEAFHLAPIRRYISGSSTLICPRCGHPEPATATVAEAPDENALGLPTTRLIRCECCGAVVLEEIPSA